MVDSSEMKETGPERALEDFEVLLDKKATEDVDAGFDKYIDKSLSMVLHHDDVQAMIAIVKKIHGERFNKCS